MRYTKTAEDMRAIQALLDAGLIDALEAREMYEYIESLGEAGS